MAELQPFPAPSPAGINLDYRPLSLWAMVGLTLGVLFTLALLGDFLLAMRSGRPMLVPEWAVLVPSLGAALAFVGQRQIKLSEGARGGLKLAQCGLWLGIASGIVLFVCHYFDDRALIGQANAFLLVKDRDEGAKNPAAAAAAGFFPRLMAGARNRAEFQRAFLLTQPPESRKGDVNDDKDLAAHGDVPDPSRQDPGKLSAFRDHFLVKLLLETDPDQVLIEPLAVWKWDYNGRRCRVVRDYRLTLPEVRFEVALTAERTDSAGERDHQWHVLLPENKKAEQLTELGKTMNKLRASVHAAAERWASSLPAKEPFKDLTDWKTLVPVEAHRQEYRPKLLGAEKIYLPPFLVPVPIELRKLADGKFRVSFPVHLGILKSKVPPVSDGHPFLIRFDGTLIVESVDAVDLQAPGDPRWQVVSLQWTHAR